MSDNITRIRSELESLGYQTTVQEGTPHGKSVTFSYLVEVGSRKGESFTVGISMQGEEPYPEYPPHWIHLTPPLDDGKSSTAKYCDKHGREWVAMSRPPGPMWDALPTKHMKAYLEEHLRRFWNNI